MDASILRLDFYTFFLGTQVSALSRLLTPASYLETRRLRRSREYIHPSVHDEGNTIFLFRVKDPGNLAMAGKKLVIRVFERNLVGGFMYLLLEKHWNSLNDSVKRAFLHGGIVGAALSWKNSYQNDIWSMIRCGFISGQVAARGEWIRQMFLSKLKNAPPDQFNIILLPWKPLSFWSGAITGSILAICETDIGDYLDYISFPQFRENDSTAQTIFKYAKYFQDVACCTLHFLMCVGEKIITCGVVYYASEILINRITGSDSPWLLVPLSGSALGIYCGIASGRPKQTYKLSVVINALCYLSLLAMNEYLIA